MTGLSGSEALEGAGQVTILSLLGMWRPRTLEVCARAGPSKGRVGLGLEIHLVRRRLGWAGLGRAQNERAGLSWAGPKRLGLCSQQLVTNLYTKVQIHMERNDILWQ